MFPTQLLISSIYGLRRRLLRTNLHSTDRSSGLFDWYTSRSRVCLYQNQENRQEHAASRKPNNFLQQRVVLATCIAVPTVRYFHHIFCIHITPEPSYYQLPAYSSVHQRLSTLCSTGLDLFNSHVATWNCLYRVLHWVWTWVWAIFISLPVLLATYPRKHTRLFDQQIRAVGWGKDFCCGFVARKNSLRGSTSAKFLVYSVGLVTLTHSKQCHRAR